MDINRPEPRRQLFKLALASIAGFIGSRIADPPGVAATQGQAVIAGSSFNESTSTTVLRNTTADGTTLQADAIDGSGWAVYGNAPQGTGVMGYSVSYRAVLGSTRTGHAVQGIAEDDGGIAFYGTSRRAPGMVATCIEPYHQTSAGVLGMSGETQVPDGLDTSQVGVFGYCDSSENAAGVVGKSSDGVGAAGLSANSVGLLGVGPIGVQGSGYYGVYGAGRQGVVGDAMPEDTGVFGWVGAAAPPEAAPGVAVHAQAEPGYTALNVVGVTRFSRSGRTSIASNKASRVVIMPGVTTASYVIATLQANRSGVYVRAVVPASGQFTIYLNKAVANATDVGFLVIN